MSLKEEIEAMARLKSHDKHGFGQHALGIAGRYSRGLRMGVHNPPMRISGYNQSTDNAVWLDLPCQPCSIAGTEKCPKGHFSCMMRLKPELIANTTMKLL